MTPQPLPCPWCGVLPETDDGETGGTVECCAKQCPVGPSVFMYHEPAMNGLDLAIDRWNDRKTPANHNKTE